MAWRTSEDLVRDVLARDYDSKNNPSLSPRIRSASIMTDAVVSCASKKNVTLSAETLKEIETQLAAHFYQISDPGYESKKTGGASGKFRGKTEMGLDATLYGQSAKMFDTSGCLNQMESGKRAGMQWLGKPRSEQTEYRDRD